MDNFKIQMEYEGGMSDLALAHKYGVSLKQIRKIVRVPAPVPAVKEEKPVKPTTPKRPAVRYENRCNYCNKIMPGLATYCDEHKKKEQRIPFTDDTVPYSIRKEAIRYPNLSIYDNLDL